MVTDQERELMTQYLSAFNGQWRVITEADQRGPEPHLQCDLCFSDGNVALLSARIVSSGVPGKFIQFEPYLCDEHAQELGVLW